MSDQVDLNVKHMLHRTQSDLSEHAFDPFIECTAK